ncbi:MAG: ATP-binding protein [Acidimicrobiia bacterium]
MPDISTPTEVRADFPAEPASAGRARRFVDATLRTWQCDGMVDVASLLVSELVANSVLHAGTPLAVVISLSSRRLRIEVLDGDPRTPARKHYSSMSTTGRGLMLVERMAADWGVRPTTSGKGVWFELDQTSPAEGGDANWTVPEFDLDAIEPLDGPDPADLSPPGGRRPGGGGPGARSRVWVLAGAAT